MRAYQYYWLLTAALLSCIIFSINHGVISWFIDNFSDIETRIATVGFLIIFLYAYAYVGLRTGLRLSRDQEVVEDWDNKFPHGADIEEKQAMVKKMLNNSFEYKTSQSAIAKGLEALGLRVNTMLAIKTHELIDREMFQDDVEEMMADGLDLLEAIRTMLLLLGLLGSVVGIILALTGQERIPVTYEDSKIFSFTMIQGMGLAYVTTMFGMGGGVILYFLILIYQHCAKNICRGFRGLMFHTFFPIIHSESFGFKRSGEDVAP